MPNGPLFQRYQVYDWPLFFQEKYMIDLIFLDWYIKGTTFPMYPVFFVQRFFEAACLLCMN